MGLDDHQLATTPALPPETGAPATVPGIGPSQTVQVELSPGIVESLTADPSGLTQPIATLCAAMIALIVAYVAWRGVKKTIKSNGDLLREQLRSNSENLNLQLQAAEKHLQVQIDAQSKEQQKNRDAEWVKLKRSEQVRVVSDTTEVAYRCWVKAIDVLHEEDLDEWARLSNLAWPDRDKLVVQSFLLANLGLIETMEAIDHLRDAISQCLTERPTSEDERDVFEKRADTAYEVAVNAMRRSVSVD